MKPDDIPQDVIESMCLTWRHDFGLMSPHADKDGRVAWSDGFPMGMTQQQKDGLRLQMRQLYQHHVLPVVMAATLAERERCILIMYAEREWGSDLVEACERIEKGLQPRVIPGWNAPSEDE